MTVRVPASLFGSFGSVAAIAKVSNFDPEQTRNAFRILYGQASGSRQGLSDGALTKRMQPAFAAMQAVYATRFAQAGINGARNVVSGKYGLAALYAGGVIDRKLLVKGLGQRFEIENLSFKTYPCCRGAHPSIEAALLIKRRAHFLPEAVESVDISVPVFTYDAVGHPFQIRDNPQVDAQLDAQFSIAYAVATAILKGTVGLKVRSFANAPLLHANVTRPRRCKGSLICC